MFILIHQVHFQQNEPHEKSQEIQIKTAKRLKQILFNKKIRTQHHNLEKKNIKYIQVFFMIIL